MSAPQPPTNGDQPGTGADATEGSATTPAETPPRRPANAAARKAAPRKPAASTTGTRKTTASTSPAVPSETAPTQVLPTTDATEVLPAGQTSEEIAAASAVPAPVAPEPLPAEPQPAESLPAEPLPAEPLPAEPLPAEPLPAEPLPAEPPPTEPQEPPAAHQAAPPARTITEVFADRLDNDGFFSALFDFTFMRYVTRKLAGPAYVVGLVLIGLSTILALIYWLGQAIATHTFLGAFVFLFGLIITVVGSALAILLLRVAIEVFVAVVAIAENTRPRRKQGP